MNIREITRIRVLCEQALNSEIPNDEAIIRIHEIVRYYIEEE